MPHTGSILHGRYAVVSCHVERPLRRRGVAPLRAAAAAAARRLRDRGADAAAGGRGGRGALARACPRGASSSARSACTRTGPRPTTRGRRAATRPRSCASRASGCARPASTSRLFCGGGWYIDAEVARGRRGARLRGLHGDGVPPVYLERGAPHLQLQEPAWLELGSRRAPARAADDALDRDARARRARARSGGQVVHAYFHDTDLLDRRRAAALRVGLAFLGLKRTATDLRELQRGLRPRTRCRSRTAAREAARAGRRRSAAAAPRSRRAMRGRRRGEHLQMCRVVVRWPPEQEPQPSLESVRVRHDATKRAARPEHAANLRDDALRDRAGARAARRRRRRRSSRRGSRAAGRGRPSASRSRVAPPAARAPRGRRRRRRRRCPPAYARVSAPSRQPRSSTRRPGPPTYALEQRLAFRPREDEAAHRARCGCARRSARSAGRGSRFRSLQTAATALGDPARQCDERRAREHAEQEVPRARGSASRRRRSSRRPSGRRAAAPSGRRTRAARGRVRRWRGSRAGST